MGCGLSDWPDEPRHASLGFHVELCDALFPSLGIEQAMWIGTSKGGALGMLYGAYGKHCKLSKLVLHDVGPGLPEAFRASLASHIADPPAFASMLEFKAKLMRSLGRQGLEMSDRDWEVLAQSWYRRRDDGLITYHYAPGLAWQFEHHAEDYDLWHAWDKLDTPTLLIRGEHSVIISDDELQRMLNTGAKCALHTRSGGHMSFLQDAPTQQVILDFIR
jgi:pimeloyl-ACP methyl ester carboxylesterase